MVEKSKKTKVDKVKTRNKHWCVTQSECLISFCEKRTKKYGIVFSLYLIFVFNQIDCCDL